MRGMAKRPSPPRSSPATPSPRRKTLSAANLAALGADPLAELLIQASVGDANLKRVLKLELAAAVGAPDLALEIDKRLTTLSTSKARVSWRKRPELVADLQAHRRMIVDRLAPLDARLALDRLVGWFDLYPGLAVRVKDPKGELSALFFDAAPDLATVGSAIGSDAVPMLAEAVETRLSEWGGWIGRAAPAMSEPLASGLLQALTAGRPRPTGRRALVVRKLADRAGDVEAWAAAFSDEDRLKPDVGAEIARRLAEAGRPVEARAALDASKPRAPAPSRLAIRSKTPAEPEPSPLWEAAEIAVLDAEGRTDDAQTARWIAFERTLSEGHLRAHIARLADFEDVEAIDRALAHAANWFDATRGLTFLMAWPALREAADMVLARADELHASADDTALWAGRLEGRYPNAALALIRSRARALARQGLGRSDEVRALSAEAAHLAELPGGLDTLPSHADFIDELEILSPAPRARLWR
jgi:hypothetical protein